MRKKTRNKKYNPTRFIAQQTSRNMAVAEEMKLFVEMNIVEVVQYSEQIDRNKFTLEEHKRFFKGSFFPMLRARRVEPQQYWRAEFVADLISKETHEKHGEFRLPFWIKKKLSFEDLFVGREDIEIVYEETRDEKNWVGLCLMFIEESEKIQNDQEYAQYEFGEVMCRVECNALVYPPKIFNNIITPELINAQKHEAK